MGHLDSYIGECIEDLARVIAELQELVRDQEDYRDYWYQANVAQVAINNLENIARQNEHASF